MFNEKGVCAERIRLQNGFAEATVEFTTALNAQLLAMMQSALPDMTEIDARIVKARNARAKALQVVLDHVREHGC